MLGQFFASDAVMYADEVSGWREAVDTVTAPLVEHGTIKPSYVDAIKESIAAPGGTYIDLGWGIALGACPPGSRRGFHLVVGAACRQAIPTGR